jgi:hypothetical protein
MRPTAVVMSEYEADAKLSRKPQRYATTKTRVEVTYTGGAYVWAVNGTPVDRETAARAMDKDRISVDSQLRDKPGEPASASY